MALKPDRIASHTDISFFMNSVAERGGIVVLNTAGSGAAMDQAEATVVPTGSTASGTIPGGILMNDMVNKDLSQTHINWHKDEMQLGGKVTLLRQGQVTTNALFTGISPTIGQAVYYRPIASFGSTTNAFVLTNTQEGSAGTYPCPQIGRFLSTKDEDGYCKVEINLT